MTYKIFHGSNLDILPTLPDNSVDAIVTDPPYGLSDNKYIDKTLIRWISGERDFIPDGKGFMGKAWDAFVPPPALWDECLRVLKPGGHLLAFFGSRTQDIGALAIRLAGFEIRDSIAWLYGSGFPKSLDISKAIDKAAGAERQRTPYKGGIASGQGNYGGGGQIHDGTKVGDEAITPEAQQWEGWGTALKPAFEPIVVARKPLIGTVAENVLTHGTGGLNIDGSRISANGENLEGGKKGGTDNEVYSKGLGDSSGKSSALDGRWPANVILDPYTAELLDEQSDASRFFYVAKASKRDRNEGLEELDPQRHSDRENAEGVGGDNPRNRTNNARQNFHPTVKPTDLMRYLVKLVTPPGGVVLDPFTGSGSTGKAAILEGFAFIGIELTDEYLPIIEGRLKHAEQMRREEESKKDEGLF
jgi:DNA modification methylase